MNPMMAGLGGAKMSSSDGADAKIDLLDSPESITKKIKKAECFPKRVEENGVISIVENILLPAAVLEGHGEFRVERRDDAELVYTDIAKLKEDYTQDIVSFFSRFNKRMILKKG
jgi:tyrosyl-tRNA synthetase